MHMGKIEAAEEIQLLLPDDLPETKRVGAAAMLVGIAFVAVAIPYWTVRLIGGALWRDVRRVGKTVGIAGEEYRTAMRR